MGGSSVEPKDQKHNRPKTMLSLKEARRFKSSSPITRENKFKELLKHGSPPKRILNFREDLSGCERQASLGWVDSPGSNWLDVDFTDKKFLDIGCGAVGGDVFYAWLNGAKLSLGIDINPHAINFCLDQMYHLNTLYPYLLGSRQKYWIAWFNVLFKKDAVSFKGSPNLIFSTFPVEEIPDNYFDIVNCSWTQRGEIWNPKLKDEAVRVTKIGGITRYVGE
jgi:SAM-dependent methyltransferase